MNNNLDSVLSAIGENYAAKISRDSRLYIEVDIGKKAEQLGYLDAGKRYRKVMAIVPVKTYERGMKVRIDGRTFVNYGQLKSGIVIPGHVIRNSRLSYKAFVPRDSMILNFT